MNGALDVKIMFSNIIHRIDPQIMKTLERVCKGTKNPYSILVHTLLAIGIEFSSETDNGIEFEFQCQINYGPE